jgi:RNA polymerase sigma-70 factor (ECF subfamily)
VPQKSAENRKKKIKSSIDELPVKCREVFLLSRYENLKYLEIADRLHISVKTVETQMSKALQHLRIRLAEFIMILLILVIRSFNL